MSKVYDSFLECAEQMKIDRGKKFVDYKCKYGTLRGMVTDENEILIHYIQVEKNQRRTGLLRNFIENIHILDFKKLAFLGVQSEILDKFLERYVDKKTKQNFECIGGDWVIFLNEKSDSKRSHS
jgi:hypothetical protein